MSENVTVEFTDAQYGTTWGHFVADAASYGVNKTWVLLQQIPVDLDDGGDDDDGEGEGEWPDEEVVEA